MDIYLSGVSCLQMKNFTNLRKDVYLDSGSSRYVKFLPFGRFLVKRHKFCTLGRSRYPNWVSLPSTLENWSRASASGLCQRLEALIPPILQARNQPCLRSTGRDFIKQRWGFTPNGWRWKNLFRFPYLSNKVYTAIVWIVWPWEYSTRTWHSCFASASCIVRATKLICWAFFDAGYNVQ